jgi:16S rRNA (guanine1207-N2)-methyltransferase
MIAKQRSYYETREFAATLRGQAIRVISKPGFAWWDGVSPATTLLADAIELAPRAKALLLGCGHGALGVALARQHPDGEIRLFDPNAVAMAMAKRTIQANQIANAHMREEIGHLPAHVATFDMVAIEAPKDRKLARRWLAEAWAALKPGGRLYAAGANEHGIRSIIADAEALFGAAGVLSYKNGNRVASALRRPDSPAGPAWAGEPGIAPGTWYEFELTVRGHTFRLRSLPGIFAYDRLDEGTKLLLETLDLPPNPRVLDVGCGYGIIGLLAARLGAAQADLIDANLLAIAAAQENIARNALLNAQARAGDGIQPIGTQQYDLVITNPPFHVGGTVDYGVAQAFIERARRVLAPGGRFLLVANDFIRYEQLLRPAFERVETIARTASYRVWSAA